MHHELCSIFTYGLNGMEKGDEHPRLYSSKEYGTLYLQISDYNKNWHGDGARKTVEENSSVFSLIRMC